MKNEYWIVADKNGYPCATRDSDKDAEARSAELDQRYPCYSPHRAVRVVPAEEVEALRANNEALRSAIGRTLAMLAVTQNTVDALFEAERILRAALSGLQDKPTPIAELVARYESEDCNFSDPEWVRRVALRYVDSMPDSQARCLLYVLASSADAEARIAAAVAAERERMRAAIADDASATTFQSLGQYRSALLRWLEPKP